MKKKIEALLSSAGGKSSSQQNEHSKGKNDFMKIYGVGLTGPNKDGRGVIGGSVVKLGEGAKSIEGGISKLPQ